MIAATIITCDARHGVLNETLASLKATDWPFPVTIVNDKNYFSKEDYESIRKQERQTVASLAALKILAEQDADWFVFMEDDLIFNKHLLHNTLSWEPIVNKTLNLGVYYAAGNGFHANKHGLNWYGACPTGMYGSQFYIMSRECLEWAITHWHSIVGMQDIKILNLSRGKTICVYSPNMVQHRSVPSVWGGISHTSNTFSEDWRHP